MENPKSIKELNVLLQSKGIMMNSNQNTDLMYDGYYHTYKGYRFFKVNTNKLPLSDYSELTIIAKYDQKIKSLIFDKLLYIESTLKNLIINLIVDEINSANINVFFDKLISNVNNCSSTLSDADKEVIENKYNKLYETFNKSLEVAKNTGKKTVTHYYINDYFNDVPIWATFENITFGDLGLLLECLTLDCKDKLSKIVNIKETVNTNKALLHKYIYYLKDLRNSIAHNEIIYDSRFKRFDPTKAMKSCLKMELNLPFVEFNDLLDYIVLIVYLLKLLNYNKSDLIDFVNEFNSLTINLLNSLPNSLSSKIYNSNFSIRINKISNFISK